MIQIWGTFLVFLISTGALADSSELFLPEVQGLKRSKDFIASSVAEPQVEDYRRSFRRASLIFRRRAPSTEELAKVVTEAGYKEEINKLVEASEFVETFRLYHQTYFGMQGAEDGVNLNEPSNLAAYLFRDNTDFRDLLRATYCVDDNLAVTTCSSFSNSEVLAQELAAGAVTTQAFLKKWEGPFNFRRTNQMLKAFACQEYPDLTDDGLTQMEISESVHTFACVDNCGATACYSCHKSMNPRASLFYTFDVRGVFNRSPSSEMAVKRDDGSVSTAADLLVGETKPRFMQMEMQNLKEYAHQLTRVAKFRRCVGKRLAWFALGSIDHSLDLPDSLKDVDQLLIQHGFRLKDFFKDYLGSRAYVLQ